MARILILEGNTPQRVALGQSGAAAFLRTFEQAGRAVAAEVINPFETEVHVAQFEAVDGIIFTGSGEKWCVDEPEVAAHRRAMEQALTAGKPVWGSCNGMQLAALVLGRTSAASTNGMEIGVARDLRLTEAGVGHPMMAGRTDGFAAPCIHRDEVGHVPEGAQLLAGNAHTPVQAFAWSDGATEVWATQYHPELRPSDVAGFIRARGIFEDQTSFLADLESAEVSSESAERLGARAQDLVPETRALELTNWLDLVETRAKLNRAA